eukprot:4542973-Prymnesium_polylepis.1
MSGSPEASKLPRRRESRATPVNIVLETHGLIVEPSRLRSLFFNTERKRGTGPPPVRRSFASGRPAGRRVGPGCRHRVR